MTGPFADQWVEGVRLRIEELDVAQQRLGVDREEAWQLAVLQELAGLRYYMGQISKALQQNADEIAPIIRYQRREIEDLEQDEPWRGEGR